MVTEYPAAKPSYLKADIKSGAFNIGSAALSGGRTNNTEATFTKEIGIGDYVQSLGLLEYASEIVLCMVKVLSSDANLLVGTDTSFDGTMLARKMLPMGTGDIFLFTMKPGEPAPYLLFKNLSADGEALIQVVLLGNVTQDVLP
jgi:hypothetical protein